MRVLQTITLEQITRPVIVHDHVHLGGADQRWIKVQPEDVVF